ncbi:hypothetical protein PMAYCL1PPCAC_00870, partial [Pristionchus mayeri]
LASAYTPLAIRCAQDCVSTGAGLVIRANRESLTVECPDESYQLISQGEEITSGRAKCTRNSEWIEGWTKIAGETSTPLWFECRKRPTPTTKTTTASTTTTTTLRPARVTVPEDRSEKEAGKRKDSGMSPATMFIIGGGVFLVVCILIAVFVGVFV